MQEYTDTVNEFIDEYKLVDSSKDHKFLVPFHLVSAVTIGLNSVILVMAILLSGGKY